ncbi:HTH_Tnp_Tc3_2 domain-containing protein [Trichonephila clavipes]|uniref:HTH_Tnp_Tc3_2 domain-containing protein n=1 Tax=Trichonephila clavipes TaxID=2585209 RepID=A0A8X6SLP1_TRICX|nr:HTH_Tnp_Tc3_2 domain-containing protein [Trichonephila clavipes]
MMAHRKGLSPDEIVNRLREISENESDGVVSCLAVPQIPKPHSCVQKIIGRFKSDGLIENKSGRGRGRKSILRDVAKRKVLKDIKIDPKLSAVKLAAETSRIMGRSLSVETVRNVIRHAGYSSRVARKKPFISLQNQIKRLEFAKTHQLKTDNFWKKLYLVTRK